MGRSFSDNNGYDDRDRRRAKKSIKKPNRNSDKAHLREYTCGNLSEEDFLDMEEEDHGKSKKLG
jgi:hypothetical protein